MPSLSKISGCFNGNSTISLTFFISSSKPPISSYVTSGTSSSLTSTASGLNTTSVCSEIITDCLGKVSTTINFMSPKPKPAPMSDIKSLKTSSKKGLSVIVERLRLVPPNETMSPLVNALPSNPCLNTSGLAFIKIPFLAGAIITFLPSFTSAFLTFIISPIPVFEFFLIMPSILIIFRPMSPG